MPDPLQVPYVNAIKRAVTPDEIRDVPILGEFYGTFNAIIDFYEYGCFPKWTVWVETLFPALGTAILQILDFGIGDILRGYFRPSNLRGVGGLVRAPTRGKRIKAGNTGRLNKRPAIPEIGNSIGKKLPGSEFFQSRKVTGLERRVWIVDSLAQRFLWYWLVADITENFVVNWTTAIMQSEACAKTGIGQVQAHRDGPFTAFTNIWNSVLNWDTDENTMGSNWDPTTGQIFVDTGQTCHITFECDVAPFGIGTVDGMQLRCIQASAPQILGGETPWPVLPPDDPMRILTTSTIQGPRLVRPEWYAHGAGFANGSNAVMTASVELTT